MNKAQSDLLFELSWEVCNKVGGIYTVVMSKAALMKESFANYILIGPYVQEKAQFDFEEGHVPEHLQPIFKELSEKGIACHFGHWKIEGSPQTILIEFSQLVADKDHIRKEWWDWFKIDSIDARWDFDEPMIWSYAAGMLIEKIAQKTNPGKVSVQCHEWMAGGALLYLKAKKARVGTVFTTHATMLGRSIAGSNQDLYNRLNEINPEQEAYNLKIQEKFLTERACAQNADCFTTVSSITALEAEHFFERKPDILVLNGLDIGKFPTIEETSIKHVTVRDRIREFLSYYFFPYYHFNLEKNLMFFILGRYEFRNKGIDVFIKALGRLNDRLKQEGAERTISVFFWIPAAHTGLRIEILENKGYYQQIKNYVELHNSEISKQIVSRIVAAGELDTCNIFPDEFYKHIKKDISHFKRRGNPPLSTHYMDEDHDIMIQELKRNGLQNREEDKVKAIVYPVYLDGHDEMINLNYYDTIAGCHLGVFPSYYEPYGYTPLEAGALGVASLTTDLAGFGRFIEKHKENDEGIMILHRMGKSDDEIVSEFTEKLYNYAQLTHAQRVHNKTVAKNLAELADWKILIENYITAHNIAVEKAFK